LFDHGELLDEMLYKGPVWLTRRPPDTVQLWRLGVNGSTIF
jgi:hypothetical protein